ncbi:hypothetical protein [Anaerotignum sp.]|nr:hypothetical protein [Anaerotignum sp.]
MNDLVRGTENYTQRGKDLQTSVGKDYGIKQAVGLENPTVNLRKQKYPYS